jgi:hypothetical protein
VTAAVVVAEAALVAPMVVTGVVSEAAFSVAAVVAA